MNLLVLSYDYCKHFLAYGHPTDEGILVLEYRQTFSISILSPLNNSRIRNHTSETWP